MNAPAVLSQPRRFPITVDIFSAMLDLGLMRDHGRVELRDGGLFEMSPQHEPHAEMKCEFWARLREGLKAISSPLRSVTEISVRLDATNAPEPDIVVWDAPRGRGMIPVDVVRLLVEVADTTLAGDLGDKYRDYANAGVPEYWVIDLAGRAIRQHARPIGGDYERIKSVPLGESVLALTIDGLTVDTSGL